MSVIISPNMNLPVPVVGAEPGPQYATDVNNSLNIIDGHNHTPGFGVPITSAAINWNADISAMNNRVTLLKSATFTVQGSPLASVLPDIGAIYVSGVDLYYNDINGNQIRMTQNGSVNSGNGSISGLTPPASASYSVAGAKFIWESDVNTSAGMDNGPVTIREEVANANGVTLQSPISLAADYSLTFPAALPGGTSFLLVDSSGNITDNIPYPLPPSSQAAVNIQTSASCGNFAVTSNSLADVPNLSITITTVGRPVMIALSAASSGGAFILKILSSAAGLLSGTLAVVRGASVLCTPEIDEAGGAPVGNGQFSQLPPGVILFDTPAAGTYTYKIQAQIDPGLAGAAIELHNMVLVVVEL